MSGEARRYPFDYDALDKGSVITAEAIEAIVGVSRDSAMYSGRQVDLGFEIEKQLAIRGKAVTVSTVKDEIHILDDSASSVHNRRLFRKGLKRLRRAHRKMLEVDAGQLRDDDRRDHDRNIVIQGAVLAGAMGAYRKTIGTVYQRKTPGLPKPT